jgi:tetratricopeptide (TPR) repeat protein
MGEFRRFGALQAYLAAGFLFSGLFFVLFANYPIQKALLLGVLHRFYIMSAVLFSFWIGLGMKRVQVWTERAGMIRSKHYIVTIMITGSLLTWQWMTNAREANFRDNHMAEDFVHNVLLCLPDNALLFAQGDVVSMGLDYLQAVLGKRRDVIALDQEKLTYPWYYKQAKARFPAIALRGERYDGVHVLNRHLISDNIDKRPVFFRFFKEDSYEDEFRAVPTGLVHRMIPRGESYPLEKAEEQLRKLYARFKKRGWQNAFSPTSFERIIKGSYAKPLAALAYGFDLAGNIDKAVHYYRQALRIDPNHSMSLKNLALVLLKSRKQDFEAVDLLRRYLRLNPGDKESQQITRVIETYGG